MRTLLACLLGCALAAPAFAGPDFTTPTPRAHALAASSGSSQIAPMDDVVFESDSTQLSATALSQIHTAARWLKRHRDYRIVVEGYADSTGFDAYNEDLATQRAFVVRQHLIGAGVDRDRIIMVSYGERDARGGDDPLDRRAVIYATKLTPQQIARASIDRKSAALVAWTKDRALFTETGRTVIGARAE